MRRKGLTASIAVLVALACVLGLAGCAQKQSNGLVGTWNVSMGSAPAAAKGPSWQFTNDGKLIETAGGGMQDVQGQYSLAGNTLKVTTPAPSGSASTTMTLEWLSDSQFRVNMGGGWLTFTRQK